MKRLLKSLLVSALVVGCLGLGAEEAVKEKDNDSATLASGNNEFAVDLYGKLSLEPGNLFFSPASISTALGMTFAGARGETEAQMAKALRFKLDQNRLHPAFASLMTGLSAAGTNRGYQLSIANALWGQKGFNFLNEFIELTKKHYGAGLREVDFVDEVEREKTRQTINAWVEKETQDKIKDLIAKDVLNELTRLVLTNAIYFKGDWASKFDKGKTKDEPFMLTADNKINVPMMNQKREFKYGETESCQMLEMPYVGEEVSMVVFLPRKVDGVPGLEKSLTTENLDTWLSAMEKKEVAVAFPKLRTASQFGLKLVLSDLGMPIAFSNSADFSGMNGKKNLCITAVIHKAFVEVNEEGTEAAAATAVVVGTKSVKPAPPVFRADRPFIFLIRDTRSGSILFMGRICDPTK